MLKIKVNKPLPGYIVGRIIEVASDKENTPLDHYWRRRLKDAATDGCCEIVKPVSTKSVFAKPDKTEDK